MAKRPAGTATEDETFPVVMPEGLTALEFGEEPEATPEGETPPAESTGPTVAKPEATAAPAPAAEPAPLPAAQPPLPPAAREERRKRKHYQGLWQRTQAELEQLKSQDRARQPAGRYQFKPAVLTPAAIAEIKQKADTAEGLGAAVEMTIGQVLNEVNAQLSMLHESMTLDQRAALLDERALWSEELARSRHDDFDAVLEKSGVKAALQVVNGQYVDPHLARKILLSPNPGELAYKLATDKLDEEDEQKEPAPALHLVAAAQPGPGNGQPAAPAAPAAPKPAASPETEAERRGQARVLEAVTKGAERVKGIRGLSSAGPVSATINLDYLDQLQDTNPDGLLKLYEKNPGLREWHLGGLTRA